MNGVKRTARNRQTGTLWPGRRTTRVMKISRLETMPIRRVSGRECLHPDVRFLSSILCRLALDRIDDEFGVRICGVFELQAKLLLDGGEDAWKRIDGVGVRRAAHPLQANPVIVAARQAGLVDDTPSGRLREHRRKVGHGDVLSRPAHPTGNRTADGALAVW